MKKSRFITLILTSAILLSFFAANIKPVTYVSASSDVVLADASDFNYRPVPASNPTSVALTKYNGSDTKIRIPDEIDGLPVDRIIGATFSDNENIEYIEIPATVSEISAQAFSKCSSLTDIVVDNANTYYSSKNGVVYNDDYTTLVAFPAGQSGSFTIPESVVSIAPYSFQYCYNLTEIKMYNNVLTIGASAFAYCWNLSSIKLSDSLKTLSVKALAYCDNLTEIHLPGSLKTIVSNALLGGIDSNGNTYYNFIDGLYYVPDTPSETFAKKLHVPTQYIIAENRSITDIDTNIKIIDPNQAIPTDCTIEFKATPLKKSDYESLIPIRFADAAGYNLTLKADGKVVSLKKDVVINFEGWRSSVNPLATKVYKVSNGACENVFRQPHSPFIGTQTKVLGKYIIAENNDFSLKGDIDGDGKRTSYDVQIALCLTADLIKDISQAQLNVADIDGKTGVTTNDATVILKYAAGVKK